ncbi:MAG TPA: thioredoxin family protein, partial [Candidatus Norongarragalinales archaeon]|nr:thioredoxin family protein [Candidatus Norongarragalinales archaeon]
MGIKKMVGLGVGALVVVGILAVIVFGGAPAYASDASPVLYFYQDACHFCQQQKPILEELAKEGFRVKMMDVRANPGFWNSFKITGTPTFLVKNG